MGPVATLDRAAISPPVGTAIAPLIAIWLSLAACGDTLQPAAVPVAEFGAAYAAAVCEGLPTCCVGRATDASTADAGAADSSGESAASLDDCGARIEAMIAQRFERASTYHATIAGDCVDARRAVQGCERFDPSATCDAVTEGPLLDPAELNARGIPTDLCTD